MFLVSFIYSVLFVIVSCYAHARQSYFKTSILWTTSRWRHQQCGPVRLYKVALKVNLKHCGIDPAKPSSDLHDCSSWTPLCQETVTKYEETRVGALEPKRAVGKFVAQPISNLGVWTCNSSFRICSSRIRLFAHQMTIHPLYRWQGTVSLSCNYMSCIFTFM